MNRNVWLLFCCQALLNAIMSGQAVMAALVGQTLAVDKTLNTLPLAIQSNCSPRPTAATADIDLVR